MNIIYYIKKIYLTTIYRFFDRCNHCNVNSLAKEESPIFIQFLECVWQIMKQYPTVFEFNEHFLISIIDNLYSCRYGTFLCNNEKDRIKYSLREKTHSLWSMMNHSKFIDQYKNVFYKDNKTDYLRISLKLNKIYHWESLYNRSDNDMPYDKMIENEYKLEKEKNELLTEEITKLKAKLELLEKEITKE